MDVLVVGVLLTLIVAILLTVRLDRRNCKRTRPRRSGRWALIGVAGLILCGAGMWLGPKGIDRWRYARTTETIVGTWHEMIDNNPWREVTFHPNGTYEERYLSEPVEKQGPDRRRYSVSLDGRHIIFLGDTFTYRIDVVDRNRLQVWRWEFLGRYRYRLVRAEQ
jgi:hypothetical protein